ncbi:class I SAM-dependent methyltransferase [Sporichthya polymorpha]|uniref:class I SAM-dependent methyltransferase n=1 Tax=Sporichthya polymorpha TaxID=35751 RepID=UPI000366EA59|nr:class I SAM-dependent methyltransferase [Sporichthya polymorpha]
MGRPRGHRPGVAEVFARVLNPRVPVRVTAFDGSEGGAIDADVTVEIASPTALSYLLSSPGELGLARAYITGHVKVRGDLYAALYGLGAGGGGEQLSTRDRVEMLRDFGIRHLRPVEPPPEEIRYKGGLLRHTRLRDSRAISHHYDVSNRFYEWVLGPSMSYTCAAFPKADSSLEEAQWNKHDLVARKLGLKEGMRLLDVGCGWGGMVRHAAKEYGVQALGVTLSKQQAEWAQNRIKEEGLEHLCEVRHMDYRDIPEDGFDAVSSIGLTEHIGAKQLPAYFSFLRGKLRPYGRMLNHCITRPSTAQPAKAGKFIDRYVFPDGELEGVGDIVSAMQDNGLEVRHEENLREHYAMTLRGWCDNLVENWADAVAEVGANRARVWLLYMAACRVAFDCRFIELHQVLGVRCDDVGTARMPLRPDWTN